MAVDRKSVRMKFSNGVFDVLASPDFVKRYHAAVVHEGDDDGDGGEPAAAGERSGRRARRPAAP